MMVRESGVAASARAWTANAGSQDRARGEVPLDGAKCFRIAAEDNVAVMLADAGPGVCEVIGEGDARTVTLVAEIPKGHKVALSDLAVGGQIVKYGIVIGRASAAIRCGQHVHLQNCHSGFDDRSSTLQVDTGVPTDTRYE